MFWDKISPLYDLFENVYNHKVYAGTGKKVAEFIEPKDDVLDIKTPTLIQFNYSTAAYLQAG